MTVPGLKFSGRVSAIGRPACFQRRPLPSWGNNPMNQIRLRWESGISSSDESLDEPYDPPFTIFRDVPPLRELRQKLFRQGQKVGFIPTMGALHDGHLSLVKRAMDNNPAVFVSIFVNPTQFAAHEDLGSYPKTWKQDLAKLKELQDKHHSSKIVGIFAPTVKVMYPTLPPTSDIAGDGSFVTITPLGNTLEGASRPIFFRGVATVCTKLFNIIQPDRVYFGQKDIQQSVLIKRMVKDFHIPTEVHVVRTAREHDGLAMSSRNVYLGERRRQDVAVLSLALHAARNLYYSGVFSGKAIRDAAYAIFHKRAAQKRLDGYLGGNTRLEIDYIALSDPETMNQIPDGDNVDPARGAVLSAAMLVYPVDQPQTVEELEQTTVRLIDNVILNPHNSVTLKPQHEGGTAGRIRKPHPEPAEPKGTDARTSLLEDDEEPAIGGEVSPIEEENEKPPSDNRSTT